MKKGYINLMILYIITTVIVSCTDKKTQLTAEINSLESKLTGNPGDVVDSVAIDKMMLIHSLTILQVQIIYSGQVILHLRLTEQIERFPSLMSY